MAVRYPKVDVLAVEVPMIPYTNYDRRRPYSLKGLAESAYRICKSVWLASAEDSMWFSSPLTPCARTKIKALR